MSDSLPIGPYREIKLGDDPATPWYIIPFDKVGRCEGPQTRQHLVEYVRNTPSTDIFLFSHGWNNDWPSATAAYEGFISGYLNMRRQHHLPTGDHKALLIGIFWPSIALAGAGRHGPKMADFSSPAEAQDDAVASERRQIQALAESVAPEHTERFYDLSQREALNEQETLEFAEILQPLYQRPDDELLRDMVPPPQEIAAIWRETAASNLPTVPGGYGPVGGGGAPGPQTASFLGDLGARIDPRNVIRMLTVWQMKDRAGVVGSVGVSPLLNDLLAASSARLHLIGHSYGAKVMLSALCRAAELPRKVSSLLLLQPAISHLCFADAGNVPGTPRPGGYHEAPHRVERPILSTFSSQDFPLTKVFHLALRRASDLGEAKMATRSAEPPSPYAALGGFGPRGCPYETVVAKAVGDPYDLGASAARIQGVDASLTIPSHGEVSNESTWWMLYDQVCAAAVSGR